MRNVSFSGFQVNVNCSRLPSAHEKRLQQLYEPARGRTPYDGNDSRFVEPVSPEPTLPFKDAEDQQECTACAASNPQHGKERGYSSGSESDRYKNRGIGKLTDGSVDQIHFPKS